MWITGLILPASDEEENCLKTRGLRQSVTPLTYVKEATSSPAAFYL